MTMQKANNFLVISRSNHGGHGCNIQLKMEKMKKNGKTLTKKTQKWKLVSSFYGQRVQITKTI